MERIETTNEAKGDVDSLEGGNNDDILFGGTDGDTIDAGAGNNIVFGDHGVIDYVIADSDASDIDLIESTSTTANGRS